jgi:serine/threonine protein kinase
MKVDDYTLEECIEQGTLGELYFSTKKDSTLKYAIKRIERERLEQGEAMKYYRNELTFLQNFDHPNILKFFDVKKTK